MIAEPSSENPGDSDSDSDSDSDYEPEPRDPWAAPFLVIEGCAYVLLAVLIAALLGLEDSAVAWGILAVPVLLVAAILAVRSLRRARGAPQRKDPRRFREELENGSAAAGVIGLSLVVVQWMCHAIVLEHGLRWADVVAIAPTAVLAAIATTVFARRRRRRLLARLREEDAAAAEAAAAGGE